MLGGISILLIVGACFLTFPYLVQANEGSVSEVPEPPKVEEASGPAWYDPLGWKEKINARLNRPEADAKHILELEAALSSAAGVQLHHDKLVENLQSQNERDVAHFESLLTESQSTLRGLKLQFRALEESMQELLDKDNSLMFVEGCFVPIPQ